MKKLALASVALAGVSVFGAGDAFATGFSAYMSQSTFEAANSPNDAVSWGGLNGGSSGTVVTAPMSGSPATFTILSTPQSNRVTVSYLGVGGTAAFSMFFNGSAMTAGFPYANPALVPNGSGAIVLTFASPVSAVGLFLSPVVLGSLGQTCTGPATCTTVFNATNSNANFSNTTVNESVLAFNGTHYLGYASLSAVPIGTTCSSSTCSFLGVANSTSGITSIRIQVSADDPNLVVASGVGPVELSDSVPEPATLSVLGVGLLGLAASRRRRNTAKTGGGIHWSPFGRWRVADSPPDATAS